MNKIILVLLRSAHTSYAIGITITFARDTRIVFRQKLTIASSVYVLKSVIYASLVIYDLMNIKKIDIKENVN